MPRNDDGRAGTDVMEQADNADDEDLLRRARAGDAEAFEAACRRSVDRLLRAARQGIPAALRRKVGASDVVQEAYLAAFERLREFESRGPDAFESWLTKIVEFKVREAVRRFSATAKRSVGRETGLDSNAEGARADERLKSPSHLASHREQVERTKQAIERLPPESRAVLRLMQKEQLTLGEAAEKLGKSREAVKKLYSRGIAKLAEMLASDAP